MLGAEETKMNNMKPENSLFASWAVFSQPQASLKLC